MNNKLICLHIKFLFEGKEVRIAIIFLKLSKRNKAWINNHSSG